MPLVHANIALNREKEMTAAAGRMLELITLPSLLSNRSRDEQVAMIKEILPFLDVENPADPAETHSVIALANVLLKVDAEARRRADLAATTAPKHPRVRLVRAILHLR